jgi:hypothetical protein
MRSRSRELCCVFRFVFLALESNHGSSAVFGVAVLGMSLHVCTGLESHVFANLLAVNCRRSAVQCSGIAPQRHRKTQPRCADLLRARARHDGACSLARSKRNLATRIDLHILDQQQGHGNLADARDVGGMWATDGLSHSRQTDGVFQLCGSDPSSMNTCRWRRLVKQ